MGESRHPRGELRLNESMARHVSWRAGGAVERAYFPAGLDDLRSFLRSLPADEPVCFVGLGSNLLVRDGGLRGTVIFTHWALRELRLDDGAIYAECGVASPKVARFAALHDFVGAEFLAGIPGTVGGALAMNAGCYGGETWNHVLRVLTMDRFGTVRERTTDHYRIGYRSVQPVVGDDASGEWFVAGRFQFETGNGAQSRVRIRELLSRRIATQPLSQPNAGSVFRNPAGDHAARLIEACGLKGAVRGGAMISPKHSNFIVNAGGATAADIEALVLLAQQAVREQFGVELEREVRIVGEPRQIH
jgi:UDP-N-acetylmuramate dehydrogenase